MLEYNFQLKTRHPKLMTHKPPVFAEKEMINVLRQLPQDRVILIGEFISQIASQFDPDILNTFLKWSSDPRIDTLLHHASLLDDDSLDQLLFMSEEMVRQPVSDVKQ